MKYILLNPVKALMVSSPEDYHCSSHNVYVGKDAIPWIETDYLLGMLGEDTFRSRDAYLKFISEKPREEEFSEIENPKGEGRIIGDEEFVKEVYQLKNSDKFDNKLSLNEILSVVAIVFGLDCGEILSPTRSRKKAVARSIIAYYCNEINHLKLNDFARMCGREAATLSE